MSNAITTKPNVLGRIAAALTDEQLVANLNTLNEALDSFVSEGLDPERETDLRKDVLLRDALRTEYRSRTGEVI